MCFLSGIAYEIVLVLQMVVMDADCCALSNAMDLVADYRAKLTLHG